MKRLMMLAMAGILLVPAMVWAAVSVPSGWSVYNNHSAPGVALYRHFNSVGGAYEFVQIVRLNQGARIVLRHGSLFDGVRGYEPMSRTYLNDHWTTFSSSRPNAFSLFNGAFFDRSDCNNVDPVGVVYSLKIANYMWCYGGLEETENKTHKMLWEIWGNEVNISRDHDSWPYVSASTASDAIVGLDETVNKSATSNIQRTFVGCGDLNGNSRYNTVLIYNCAASTQANAVSVLQQFGANHWMMFDGGSSTMLQCEDETIIGPCRAVPQTIGVVAADDIPPSVPTNLSVSPTGCSQTNGFAFNWTQSTDTGGSGLAGYEWNLNGSETVSLIPATPNWTTYAPAAGSYTFYVRAKDGAGNHSAFASIGFCYEPPTSTCPGGPCPGRYIPNSCLPVGTCCTGTAPNMQSLPDATSQQWASVGQPVRGKLTAGTKYSIGFEYRATTTTDLKLGLGSFNPTSDLGLVITTSNLPVAGEWKTFWSTPFTPTAEQLERFSSLKFLPSTADGFAIRNVRIVAYQQ